MSAAGCETASAAAVRAAASTGPTPHTSVSAPSAPRSSSVVAATTRITARTVSRGTLCLLALASTIAP